MNCSSWISIVGSYTDCQRLNSTQFTFYITIYNYKYVTEYCCWWYIFIMCVLLTYRSHVKFVRYNRVSLICHICNYWLTRNLYVCLWWSPYQISHPSCNGSLAIARNRKLKKMFALPHHFTFHPPPKKKSALTKFFQMYITVHHFSTMY
jgi:hypothetical protein